jgi:hypothetical protein
MSNTGAPVNYPPIVRASRHPREKTEEFTLEQRPDGSSVTSIRKKVTYRVSGPAAEMVRSIMPSAAETPPADENT